MGAVESSCSWYSNGIAHFENRLEEGMRPGFRPGFANFFHCLEGGRRTCSMGEADIGELIQIHGNLS